PLSAHALRDALERERADDRRLGIVQRPARLPGDQRDRRHEPPHHEHAGQRRHDDGRNDLRDRDLLDAHLDYAVRPVRRHGADDALFDRLLLTRNDVESRFTKRLTDMTKLRSLRSGQKGFAMVYMAALLFVLLLFTGLAVDTGRAYVVKAQLTKAVDGAALAAARNLNSGNPRQEAVNIFRANYPGGFMGTTSVTDPTSDPGFFSLTTDPVTGINTVRVTAQRVMPTTFMKLAQFQQVTVSATGEATRRMVDLSLVLDVSSSIGSQWGQVRDAARSFISAFDGAHDRMSLLLFSNG